MVICYNDKELERALEAKESKIILEGPQASEIVRRIEEAQSKRRNTHNTALGIGLLCLIAAPFTGGGSLLGLIGTVVVMSTETIKAIKEYEMYKLDHDRIEFRRK